MHCTVLVLYCIVLHCTVLYCVVLYCTVLYCVVLCCIVLYCIVLYCIALLHCIVALHCIVLYCIVLYCVVLCCVALHCTVLCSIVLYLLNTKLLYIHYLPERMEAMAAMMNETMTAGPAIALATNPATTYIPVPQQLPTPSDMRSEVVRTFCRCPST